MLKVCQICSVLPPGRDAVGEGALKLKFLLKEKGYQCIILTSSNQAKSEDIYPFFKNWGILSILKSVKFLRKNKVDMVIFHYPTSYYKRNIFVTFIFMVYGLFGLKAISFLHEYSNYSLLGKIRILPLILFSKRIITSDHDNFNSIIKIPFARNKLDIITVGSNFLNLSFYGKPILPKIMNPQPSKYNLLYFGYIMQGKGLDILLDAFTESTELKDKFVLHLAGNTPEIPNRETKALLDLIMKFDFLNYHGFVPTEELSTLFYSIDIVCLPFKNGVTIRRGSFMTSIAFGKPVLTTKSKHPIDGLKENENVFFINQLSKESLISELISISKFKINELNEIGNKAKSWYMNNYSDENYIKKIIRVIDSI
ncbi:MAG: glycosyltransferase family 4 protein [Ignavibacteriaceae bacterium]